MTSMKFPHTWTMFRQFLAITQPSTRGLWSRRIKFIPKLTLNQILERNRKVADAEWMNTRKEILSTPKLSLTEINVDSVIMDTCVDSDNIPAALSYAKFLINNNYKLNFAVIGKYLKLLHLVDRDITKEEEEEIIKFHENIRKEHPILDAMTAENCILALSKTREWKKCFELVKILELSSQPKTIVLSALVRTAFEHDDNALGWEHLQKIPPRLWPISSVYTSYLDHCHRISKSSQEFKQNIEKLFIFWKQYDIHPSIEDMENYSKACQKNLGWSGKETTIKSSGQCPNCGHRLDNLQLTPEDFEYLSNLIIKKVVIGEDIYNKSTPEEFKKFLNFVKTSKPYDVVIDGLNAAYSLKSSRNNRTLGKELAGVVRAFKDQKKKVMILGRAHMENWSNPDMNYIYQNAKVFLAENSSQDDPYLLYATLAGGLNTYFSSKDLMRQHKFLMDNFKAKQIFKNWQMTRQIVPRYIRMRGNSTLFLTYPPAYVPTAQKDSKGWHIPCTPQQFYGTPPPFYEPSKIWYCLRSDSQQ